MTELTAKQQDVIERVQKLLALANNNPNEHEAQAAAAKAMDLLSAYNLSMHQVGDKKTDQTRKDNKRKGGLYQWQRDLWGAVAKLNFCVYSSIKGTAKGSTYEHRLVGSEVNVVSTEVMADYLQGAVERMGQTYAKEQGFKSVFVKEAIAYREGVATRLVYRLNELREKRMREEKAARASQSANTGNALILADVIQSEEDLNNDYLNGWKLGTTAENRAKAEARYNAWHAEHERKLREDPEYAAELEAQKNRNDEWWEEHKAKRDKNEARRMKRANTPGYDNNGYKIQYRAATPQEQRTRLSGYRDGYVDGASVNLDQQIDEETRLALERASKVE